MTIGGRTGRRGDVTDTHVEWIVKRQVPNKVSPLLVGTSLYGEMTGISSKGVNRQR